RVQQQEGHVGRQRRPVAGRQDPRGQPGGVHVSRAWAFVVALVAGLAALMVVSPDTAPTGIVAKGALFGAATGLLAVGLVLTYQTTRVINFSYGAMGTLG